MPVLKAENKRLLLKIIELKKELKNPSYKRESK